jgi:hypothetical protein
VDDADEAVERANNRADITVLGDLKVVPDGPMRGSRWCYLRTSWGQLIEVVNRDAADAAPRSLRGP